MENLIYFIIINNYIKDPYFLVFNFLPNLKRYNFHSKMGVVDYLVDFILVGSRVNLIFVLEKAPTQFFQIVQIWLKVNFGMVSFF